MPPAPDDRLHFGAPSFDAADPLGLCAGRAPWWKRLFVPARPRGWSAAFQGHAGAVFTVDHRGPAAGRRVGAREVADLRVRS